MRHYSVILALLDVQISRHIDPSSPPSLPIAPKSDFGASRPRSDLWRLARPEQRNFCPGKPRIFCLWYISIPRTRRHQRPGGGVVGIDGPPPSRRDLSLSHSFFLYVYVSLLRVDHPDKIARSRSLLVFGNSAMQTALTAIDGKHPPARGDYSA